MSKIDHNPINIDSPSTFTFLESCLLYCNYLGWLSQSTNKNAYEVTWHPRFHKGNILFNFHFYSNKPCNNEYCTMYDIKFFYKFWTLSSSIFLFFCRLKTCRIIIQYHHPLMLQTCPIFRHTLAEYFFKPAWYRRSSAWNLGRSIVSCVENEINLRCFRVSNGDHGQLVEYRFILHW